MAAAWFGLWGTAAAGTLYLTPALDHGPELVVLFVLLPGLASAVAGAVVGASLLDPERSGPVRAAGLGLLAVLLAYLVFGVLFAGGLWLAEPDRVEPGGLALVTPTLGLLMTGVVTLPVGALAGWLLYVLR